MRIPRKWRETLGGVIIKERKNNNNWNICLYDISLGLANQKQLYYLGYKAMALYPIAFFPNLKPNGLPQNLSLLTFFPQMFTEHGYSNSSCHLRHGLASVYLFIFIVGFLGNLLLFIILMKQWCKRKLTITNIYLLNLAVADFFLICTIPFWLTAIRHDYNWVSIVTSYTRISFEIVLLHLI